MELVARPVVCKTEHIKAETVEDHPVCRVEMVDNCDKSRDKFGACERVPAMRCRIEQRVVVQSKPETKCERVPQSLCHEEECRGEAAAGPLAKADDPLCYFRDQVVSFTKPQIFTFFIHVPLCKCISTDCTAMTWLYWLYIFLNPGLAEGSTLNREATFLI